MTAVRIPPVLRAQAGNQKKVEVTGSTVGEALDSLLEQFPGLREQVFTDDGSLNRFVNVYVNGRDVRYEQELATAGRGERRGHPAAGHGRGSLARSLVVTSTTERQSGTEVDALRPHAHGGNARHGGRFPSIVDAIGFTPLVEVPNVCPNPNVRLYAKLEFMNPTGSVKDRVAKYLIEDLERSGRLQPDSIIIEPTSGNTGIGLAMIARRKGYRVAVVVPDNVTMERRQLLALFGAEVIDSPGPPGLQRRGGPGQAPRGQGPALRDALPVRQSRPTRGPTRRPRPRRSSPTAPRSTPSWPAWARAARLWAWGGACAATTPMCASTRPSRCPASACRACARSTRASSPRSSTPRSSTASSWSPTPRPSRSLRELTEKEGIFAGVSCGAVMVAAKQLAREMERGTIVALLADGGWKYLSEDIWTRDLDADEDEIDSLNLW